MKPALIIKFLSQTRLIRPPQKLLSTFGATRIHYHLVSPIDEMAGKTRLREGWVVSQRPKIITAQTLRERFEGFGEDSQEFTEWLGTRYKDLLRALEYNFKNQDLRTTVLAKEPALTSESILKDIDERSLTEAALIECPDAAWSLALMRFTLEESARSFPTHVRDLENHGMFDPGSNEARRRRSEIEKLFAQARHDASAREALGAKLREYGLFSEFEDRFLGLYR